MRYLRCVSVLLAAWELWKVDLYLGVPALYECQANILIESVYLSYFILANISKKIS